MTLLILIVLLVVAIGVASLRHRAGRFVAPPRLPPPLEPEQEESPTDLALRDPAEALRLYGTPEDAARLGADLGALGYRPRDGD